MGKVIQVLSSLLIMSGGVYTIYYYLEALRKIREKSVSSITFFAEIQGAFDAIDQDLYKIPIIIGGLVVLLGILSMWKWQLAASIISFMLALLMFNWLGVMLSLIGSTMGIVLWGKRAYAQQ